MKIESEAFKTHSPIPSKYTCDGEDVSPPLTFHDIPNGTKSLALVADDPDAPRGTVDHWIVWNLKPEEHHLSEGAKVGKHGSNSYGLAYYRGPCPPKGAPHRYFFKLYALDTILELPEGISKQQLEEAMEGHIIGKAELVGTYQRK